MVDLKTYVIWLLSNYDKEEVTHKLFDEGYDVDEIIIGNNCNISQFVNIGNNEDDVKEILALQ